MFLGVTDFGWILLAVVYLPVSILVLVLSYRILAIPLVWKVIALLSLGIVLLALPIADSFLSSRRMHQYCPESGLKVFRRVIVDGYFDEELGGSFLKGTGYKFREHTDFATGRYTRVEISQDGSVNKSLIDRPKARYHYRKWSITDLGLGVKKSEKRIVDSVSGEAIAIEVAISRTPGFIDRLWIGWFGPLQGIETCYQPGQTGMAKELRNILIPLDRSDSR